MGSNSRKSGSESFSDGVIKAIANAIAALVIGLIAYWWEFQVNPSGNFSFEADSSSSQQVYAVAGVSCHGDKIPWQFEIADTWYSSSAKKSKATLRVWRASGTGAHIDEQEVEIKESGHFYLEACPDEEVSVAYVWDIKSGELFVHFRVHPEFEFYSVKPTALPQKEGK